MWDERIGCTIKALRQNGMEAEYIEGRTELLARLQELLPRGTTVASGSSETLTELGVRAMLAEQGYLYLDAGDKGLSAAQRDGVIRQTFGADVYLTSVAAITEAGELLVVDGTGNRVAALAYGPQKVVIIAGRNKLVPDWEAALTRLKTVAAPKNALRRGKLELPCAKTGECVGCKNPLRMCCSYLKIGFTRAKGRFNIFIVGEDLGF